MRFNKEPGAATLLALLPYRSKKVGLALSPLGKLHQDGDSLASQSTYDSASLETREHRVTTDQLVSELCKLPKTEKIRIARLLLAQVADEVDASGSSVNYDVSSFYNCELAATQLSEFLSDKKLASDA